MISVGILDRGAPAPLHEQLAHGLRAAILAGRANAGDVVPSSRALAADLGVARGTVVAAYEILAGEGYLLTRPGGGTLVADVARAPQTRATPRAVAPEIVVSAVDLRPGRPGVSGIVDAAWRSAWRRASGELPDADVDDARGDPGLRAQIAAHLARTRGLDVTADDVLVTAGTSDAMLLLLLALRPATAGARMRVGIENPGYPRVRRILDRVGAEAVAVPVHLGRGLDLDAVEAHDDLDVLIVTPHHHYPLGSRLDAADRARLLRWAARTETVVVEDDYDSEFPHGRAPLPPLHLLDPARVVLIGSFSKVLAPSLRCGWIVATDAVRDAVARARSDLDPPVSQIPQRALALYLEDGALARHTARRRRDYRHRRRLLLDAFAGVDGVELLATDGGLHAVAVLPGAGSAVESAVVDDVARRGIRVAPLSSYAVPGETSDLPAGIVFGYAEPSILTLVEAIGDIIDVLRRHGAQAGSGG